jgi:hypothetical protein
MTIRRAECSCGRLRLTARGDPLRVSMCHCLACQRRTGSVFGAQARFHVEDVDIEGDSRSYTRTADSGNTITFHFCPECGATLCYRLAVAPDVVAVPVGAFGDPDFPAPRFSVYEARRHPWVGVPEGAERHW